MTNQYIQEGTLRDAYNDYDLTQQLRYILSETSAMCVKFEYDNSMKFNKRLMREVNDSITHILNAHLEPVEGQINEAIRHHEDDRRGLQSISSEDGGIPAPIS